MPKVRIKLIAVGATAAFVAAGAVAVATGPVAAQPPRAEAAALTSKAVVIKFTEKVVSERSFNLDGSENFGVGTVEIGASKLRARGKTIGRGSNICTATRVTTKSADLLCTGTLAFSRGQVSVQGLVRSSTSGPGTFKLAVVGGTGMYKRASGYLTVTAGEHPVNKLHITY